MSDPRTDRWQLPDGVDELLPEAAWRVELLRRAFIDRCRSWGFELVMPPLIEYVDSLLTGAGETMDLQTFKLVDQHSGRTLGVRADMTTQVARVDAHALASDAPNRLCYTGTVLRARADGAGGSRSPQQFGAELFGHAGVESDVEICRLMLEIVCLAGVPSDALVLDFGHVGVYRALAADAALAPDEEALVFEALGRGSLPDLEARLAVSSAGPEATRRLVALCELRGDESLLGRARALLDGAGPGVPEALDTLERLIAAVRETHPDIAVHVDLAELRGYSYHTGPLFAVHGRGAQLARGGRYDRVGEAFGRARPATGFSGDLKRLADGGIETRAGDGGAILVPEPDAPGAWAEARRLRERGERVLFALPDASSGRVRCDRQLVRVDGRWTLHRLEPRPSGPGGPGGGEPTHDDPRT